VAAHALTADLPGVAFVRGDLLRLPLEPGRFRPDLCLGVLDQPRSPRGVPALARPVEAGGRIAVWVYPRERGAHAIMRATARSRPGCRSAARGSKPPDGPRRRREAAADGQPNRLVARVGSCSTCSRSGLDAPDPEVRVCDTHDWYAPRYLSWHDRDEVRGWFAEAGWSNVTDLSQGQVHFHAGQGNGINFRRPPPPARFRPWSPGTSERTSDSGE